MNIPQEILRVAQHLGELREDVVFLGGMVRPLLITDPLVPGVRPTKDVDVIVDVPSLVQHGELMSKLRKLGFKEDMSDDAPICRYLLKGGGVGQSDIPVDIMPLDASVLGFANRWYPSAFKHATRIDSAAGSLRIVDAPHYLATKLESFADRGHGDFYHHDLEDLVVLLDGRASLLSEVQAAPPSVLEFIVESIRTLLTHSGFLDSLPGHLLPDAASQARIPLLRSRLHALAHRL